MGDIYFRRSTAGERITLAELADSWLVEHDGSGPLYPEDWPRSRIDLGDIIEDEDERSWQVIEAIVADATEAQLRFLVATAIEDYISTWPWEVERVEALAARDERFRTALQGLFQYMISDEIYARVRAASGNPVRPEEMGTFSGPEERRRDFEEQQRWARLDAAMSAPGWSDAAAASLRKFESEVDPETDRPLYVMHPGATDRDARDVWCLFLQPEFGYGGSDSIVCDGADRRRIWPEPRDCSDPNDVPAAVRLARPNGVRG
jgi:hypothetical protein